MASQVEICNRALQKLGATVITSLSQNSVTARAASLAYQPVLEAELRKHNWNFAMKRASLAADATAPEWGKTNSFTLPSDFLKLADDYPEYVLNDKDWIIEADQKIVTNDTAPLYIRYVGKVTDPNKMDSTFREAFSAALALEMCEQLTQSNAKWQGAWQMYKEAIAQARKANAFEKVSVAPPEDTYLTVRR